MDEHFDLSQCVIVKTTYPGGQIDFRYAITLLAEAGVFRAPFDPKEWMSLGDAADALDISDYDVLDLVVRGQLEAMTHGRQLWILKRSVREAVRA